MADMPQKEIIPLGKENCKTGHFTNLWIIFYRHGMNPELHKYFYYDGNFIEARKRAIDHCKTMGYKFIFLRPMIVDIDKEEEYKIKGIEPEIPER